MLYKDQRQNTNLTEAIVNKVNFKNIMLVTQTILVVLKRIHKTI